MSGLSDYRKKRKVKETPEPKGQLHKREGELVFVVQKHKASHLHYDLRLELDGVLKSWAVPKGPPTEAEEKRLAVRVEDHPFEYKDFEGVIPKGNYGAGTVTIWDKGTFTALNSSSQTDEEKRLRAGLKKGHVVVVFKGKKLRGEYHLVQTHKVGQENTWLLFKKSQDELGSSPKKTTPDAKPREVSPMLAQLAEKPFNRKDWLFEIKWDGYRTIARVDKGKVSLISRNQKSFNKQFGAVAEDLKQLAAHEAILDGEVVVLDSQGRSRFQLLQNYLKTREGSLVYYVFDLLYCDGKDLRNLPLIERKERLEILLSPLKKNTRIHYSDHIEEKGISFFKEVKKRELEGIVAKNAKSSYQMKRSRDWQKIKTKVRQEVVIGGFTAPQNSREKFGSLMVGVFDGKTLNYIGQVGTGFSDATLKELADKLRPLVQQRSPFESHPKLKTNVTYVKPKLVCEVSFTEWTADGNMRHPVFEGLRPC